MLKSGWMVNWPLVSRPDMTRGYDCRLLRCRFPCSEDIGIFLALLIPLIPSASKPRDLKALSYTIIIPSQAARELIMLRLARKSTRRTANV